MSLWEKFSFDFFKILLLTRATEDLEAEKTANEEQKVRYLREKLPPLQLSGLNIDDLQVWAYDTLSKHMGLTVFLKLIKCHELKLIFFCVESL